jgi:hypothetical protein
MATARPNVQNASKHTSVGKRFRKVVEAPEGEVFVEVDVNAYHAVVMGWLARDWDYMRFANLDPHSIAATWMLDGKGVGVEAISLNWTDAQIRHEAKRYRKTSHAVGKASDGRDMTFQDFRGKVAKVFVLGNQLGLQPREAWRKNRRYIASIGDAEYYKEIIDRRFHRVYQFKDSITRLAAEQGYLQNVWGRVHPFQDVMGWARERRTQGWKFGPGTQYNEALAFMVQSSAFDHKLELLLRWMWGEVPPGGHKFDPAFHRFRNDIHDAILMTAREETKEQAAWDLQAALTMRSKVALMDFGPDEESGLGLRVRVGAEWGRNWAEMTEF